MCGKMWTWKDVLQINFMDTISSIVTLMYFEFSILRYNMYRINFVLHCHNAWEKIRYGQIIYWTHYINFMITNLYCQSFWDKGCQTIINFIFSASGRTEAVVNWHRAILKIIVDIKYVVCCKFFHKATHKEHLQWKTKIPWHFKIFQPLIFNEINVGVFFIEFDCANN